MIHLIRNFTFKLMRELFLGYTTVKRGCLNETDGGIQVGLCEETPSNLPGSDLHAVERMCVCTTDKCNSAPTHFAIINLSAVALFIIYLL